MSKVQLINVKDIVQKEIIPGYHAQFVHSEHITFAMWDIEEGNPMKEHAHPHEQITYLTEGKFKFIIDGIENILEPGMIAVIPPLIPHSGLSLSHCKIIDVFYPTRDEFK